MFLGRSLEDATSFWNITPVTNVAKVRYKQSLAMFNCRRVVEASEKELAASTLKIKTKHLADMLLMEGILDRQNTLHG